jgi:hypothetical protein
MRLLLVSLIASRWTDNGAAGGTATDGRNTRRSELESIASGSRFLEHLVGVLFERVNRSAILRSMV